jgi:hypothetical protein
MFFILLVLFIIFLIIMPQVAITAVFLALAVYFWYITLPLVIIYLMCTIVVGIFGREQ